MTRANTEQQKHTPWFAKAGAACSIIPISRAVGPNAFALKGGGYAVLFSAQGTDPESLTDQELEAKVRGLEGALRGLPEGFTLYQYTRVLSGFDIPRQSAYADPVTENFVTDRLNFLNETAKFRRVDLHWCLAIKPPQGSPFSKKPRENAEDNSRQLAELLKAAAILESHLGHSIGLQLLDKAKAFQFFSYLFNLEEWSERDQVRGDSGIDRQIVKSPISWHTDHQSRQAIRPDLLPQDSTRGVAAMPVRRPTEAGLRRGALLHLEAKIYDGLTCPLFLNHS